MIFILSWHQLSFLVFQVARVSHYHYIRNTDPLYKNKLRDTIILTKADKQKIVWLEKDEISYCGRMFDVKKQLHRSDTTILIGHYDSKDDMLLTASFSFFDDRPIHNGNKKNSIKLLVFDAILDKDNNRYLPIPAINKTKNTMVIYPLRKPIYIASSSPPPELVTV